MKRAVSILEINSDIAATQRVLPVPVVVLVSFLLLGVMSISFPVMAQDETASAAVDSVLSEDGDPQAAGLATMAESIQDGTNDSDAYSASEGGGFFTTFTNKPKAGVKANDRTFLYYGEWENSLGMYKGSLMTNTVGWSQEEYRKQDKTVEKRSLKSLYNAGSVLPFSLGVNGSWNWSEDFTTNTSGNPNLSKRDIRLGTVTVSKKRVRTGPLLHSFRGGFGINTQNAITQHKKNDFNESNFNGGIQTGMNLIEGVTAAGRVYGKNVSGDRTLGDSTSPSSATTDSLGIGIYFKRGKSSGRVSVTRGNFDRKYLAFRTDAFGLIDTVGRPEAEKIVEELETKDAVTFNLANILTFNRFKFETKYNHTTSNQNFARAAAGLKERSADEIFLGTNFGVGRDSFVIAYNYQWKWDDHRPNGQGYRGRQYLKNRNLSLVWLRTLFKATKLNAKFETSLSQDTAENQYNNNDKDRVGNIVNIKAERKWSNVFRASLMFGYKSTRELSLRSSKSANNNQKDSYELAPGFTWDISKWLVFTQNYRLYIQYTDYLFSDLDYVDKEGNYNKRGNLNTRVTFLPTDRLKVVVKHDYNKRFNATETSEDAAGTTYYNKDQIQAISKVDLAMVFRIVDGVTIEGATFRTKDDKETFGSRAKKRRTLGGEVWVGTRVNKKWGAKDQIELSMTVKKVNAYGPSVSKESSDFWDADVWLKWSF